ncbi:Hypothetical predicted protein, partial [Podarcis lilfordi]
NQVFARNFVGDIPWVPATVVGVTGPHSYQVALEDGRLWRRHIDQLRRRVGYLGHYRGAPNCARGSGTDTYRWRGSTYTSLADCGRGAEPSRFRGSAGLPTDSDHCCA